jgi:hypothetical protein
VSHVIECRRPGLRRTAYALVGLTLLWPGLRGCAGLLLDCSSGLGGNVGWVGGSVGGRVEEPVVMFALAQRSRRDKKKKKRTRRTTNG